MVIILEGIDRVGKTTLGEKLSKELNIPIYKKEREGHDIDVPADVKDYMNYSNAMGLVQMVNNGLVKDFIFDRFHWTELVYGTIDRFSVHSQKLMKLVELNMLKNRQEWLIVYVRPTNLKWSSREHGSTLASHLRMYELLVKETDLPVVIVNGHYDIDRAVEDIVKQVKGHAK